MEDLSSPKAPTFRHVINDGFIPRLCRSFISSLDGERAWRDITNRLDESTRSDYFRLNVSFEGTEPPLDDIGCMTSLRRSVHLQPQGAQDRMNVASALLIASFYFELETPPLFQVGQYLCTGSIRCRNDFRAVCNSLATMHTNELEIVTETESLGVVTANDLCEVCRLYHKKVQFHVRQLEDIVTIFIRISGLERRKISGFPHTMQWFMTRQRLDAPFGRLDHDQPLLFKHEYCGKQSKQLDRRLREGKRKLNWPQRSKKRARR